MTSNYLKLWQGWEEDFAQPKRATAVRQLDWKAFRESVMGGHASHLIGDMYCGEVYILKGAFPEKFMNDIRTKLMDWRAGRPSEFHKMLDGCPDFHRIIDHETGLKYAFRQCKHAHYFYRWNSDPLGIIEAIDARWSVIKLLMGLAANEYVANKASDGVADRVQVVRYPPGTGYLEPHADAHEHQRLFISGYMSKRGRDYRGGGFYLVGEDDKPIDVEDQIEVGDVSIGYASVVHGVAPCLGQSDWEKTDGRWFLSLYSNATDHVQKRATGRPERVTVPGVLPFGIQ